jgi:formylglycine-generating enzyme required for sulfatase activity
MSSKGKVCEVKAMQEKFLGDYRILKSIGRGALGDVLLAEHRFLKKNYILKVLPKELSQDSGFIQRFEEEVAKLILLDHPHIVKMHNVSFDQDVYFLITDCVGGPDEISNLPHYLAHQKELLKEEEVLRLLRQVAEALDYAHTKMEVAHLALKLNNFLIGNTPSGPSIFISDFGLARMISPGKVVARAFKAMAVALEMLPFIEESEETYTPVPFNGEKMSQLGYSFLQNYAFLAPEQKRFEKAHAAADIYAFGVLAYYLIAGQFPEGAFPLPSTLMPEFVIDWDTLLIQCLNPDPQSRPQSLLPLLERKKRKEVLAKSESRIICEEIQNEIAKESLKNPPLRPLSHQVEREEPLLRPLSQKNSENPSAALADGTAQPVGVAVQEKESPPSDHHQDETYAQQLNAMLNRDPIVTQYHPEKKEARLLEPLLTEMVIIKGGQFLQGSNTGNRDEMPQHTITLNNFTIDIHPVTNEQFLRFLDFMGGEKDQNYNDLIRLKDSRISRAAGKLSIEAGYGKHPIVGVTWYGAVAYAKWVGKRLPTEAEWEIAARGGLENCTYPTGEQIEKSQANFFSSDTSAVRSYSPNGYGIFDMVGNVYEWCQDWYGYNYYETAIHEPNNPKGPLQGVYRVLRGGCWKSLHDDMRCSYRHRNNPGAVNSTYGFRCAADG